MQHITKLIKREWPLAVPLLAITRSPSLAPRMDQPTWDQQPLLLVLQRQEATGTYYAFTH